MIKMNKSIEIIRNKLFSLQDAGYKAFHSKLMPDIDPDIIIGIRIPELRKLAKELSSSPEAEIFLAALPHKYYEEKNLHAFLIENISDYELCIKAVNEFLPYVDNWATCDSLRPKVFKKHLPELENQAFEWLNSADTFTVRFGIECLMLYFLGENFSIDHANKIAKVDCSEYYVSMMVAWYFATALAKQHESAIAYVEQKKLPKWVHNKTIQKAVESYRITKEHKTYLKSLRIK